MAQQNMKPTEKLAQVFNALDSMTVQGFSNFSTMTASMSILRDVIRELQEAEMEAAKPLEK